MAEFTRVDIGFQGGQVLSVRVPDDEYPRLHKAVEKGDGWHELKTHDSDVFLNLGEVVYVRVDTEEQRVGF